MGENNPLEDANVVEFDKKGTDTYLSGEMKRFRTDLFLRLLEADPNKAAKIAAEISTFLGQRHAEINDYLRTLKAENQS